MVARRPAALPQGRSPAEARAPAVGRAVGETPLPRPVAIAAARAAVHRSRTAVPHAAVTAAAWQRGLRRAPDERPVRSHPGDAADASRVAPRTGAGTDDGQRDRVGRSPAAPPPAPGTADTGSPTPAPARGAAGARLRAAFVERLPLWVQMRCAVEPKTLAALVVVLLVAVGFAVHHFLDGRPEAVSVPEAAPVAGPPAGGPVDAADAVGAVGAGPEPVGGPLVVDVAGEVREPGVHRLPRGSRVADALKAAGGVSPGTDEEELGGLNQARRLVDGEQIVVGAAGATSAPSATAGMASAATGADAATARISLSSATAEQLETLPGVGPVLAQHIIDYRAAHGGFTSVDQLREVDGIGDARFADIEPKVGP